MQFEDHLDEYRTRRINLTFRYVPVEDILDYKSLPQERIRDTKDYVKTLSSTSEYWKGVFSLL